MTSEYNARVLLIIVCLTCQAVENAESVPNIIGQTERTETSGSDFDLICQGKGPLTWRQPYSAKTSFKERENTTATGFENILEVRNADYLVTGYYECRETDDSENPAKVYVYVKDEEHLLALEDNFVEHLVGYENRDVVIPCRPTSPDVDVTLYKSDEPVELADPGGYDPKIGFTLRKVTLLDSADFQCRAGGPGGQTFEFLLSVHPYSERAPRPDIHEDAIKHVVLGAQLAVSCSARTYQGHHFDMDWILPRNFSKGEIEFGNFTNDERSDPEKFTKKIIIWNVTKADEGNYTCRTFDAFNHTDWDTKFVKVHTKEDKYINLTVHSERIEVDAGEDALWIVDLRAHPNAQFQWLKFDGEDLTNSRGKYVLEESEHGKNLIISTVSQSDSGNYTIKAFNENDEKTITLRLVVKDVPSVRIVANELYQVDVPKNVSCQVSGFEVQEITWKFRLCEQNDDIHFCGHSEFQQIPISWDVEVEGLIESVIEWNMTDYSELVCEAANKEGVGTDSRLIRVTDVPDGFTTRSVPDEMVVGDDITFTCGVEDYHYKPEIKWMKRNGSTYSPVSGADLKSYSKVHSHWAELKVANVNKSHSGEYACRAEEYSGSVVEKFIVVNVSDLETPEIFETNLNGSEMSIESWRPLEWQCFSRGMPTPTIRWYKDEELLSSGDENSFYELLNGNQTLKLRTLTLKAQGVYKCRVENRGGIEERFVTLKLKDLQEPSTGLIATVVVVAILFVGLIIFVVFTYCKMRKEQKELNLAGLQNFNTGMPASINKDLPLDEQTDLLPYNPKWEFPRNRLKLGIQLGCGAFGVVLKGEAQNIKENEETTTVAVKMVRKHVDSAYVRALASELKILIHLGKHLNVVNLLGACTKNVAKLELLVIVEFCKYGSVHNYLQSHRSVFIDQIDPATGEIDLTKGRMIADFRTRINYATLTFPPSVDSDPSSALASFNTDTTCISSQNSGVDGSTNNNPDWCPNLKGDYKRSSIEMLSTSTLVCWAFQIARGMEYLASRKVLHGDLAARNVLLAENNIVKICDFGFAKNIYSSPEYQKTGNGPVPVKWMAIESVTDRIFSTQSDVWSFGVVLWELFSLARTPYPGLETYEVILQKLLEGHRMHKPDYATRQLYDIMLECWNEHPQKRPSFTDLVEKLGKCLESNVREHYIELDPYKDRGISEGEDYLNMVKSPSHAPRYVNVPSKEVNSEGPHTSEYLDMSSPWTPVTPPGSMEDSMELNPMLSPRERFFNFNDDYLIPRQTPFTTNSALNPSYVVSSIVSEKKPATYGKINNLKDENEPKKVKDNINFFENIRKKNLKS